MACSIAKHSDICFALLCSNWFDSESSINLFISSADTEFFFLLSVVDFIEFDFDDLRQKVTGLQEVAAVRR